MYKDTVSKVSFAAETNKSCFLRLRKDYFHDILDGDKFLTVGLYNPSNSSLLLASCFSEACRPSCY